MLTDKQLAIIAYETYCETTHDPLEWDDLTSGEQAAWRAVAKEIREEVEAQRDDRSSENGSLFDSHDEEDEDDDA